MSHMDSVAPITDVLRFNSSKVSAPKARATISNTPAPAVPDRRKTGIYQLFRDPGHKVASTGYVIVNDIGDTRGAHIRAEQHETTVGAGHGINDINALPRRGAGHRNVYAKSAGICVFVIWSLVAE